MLFDVKFEADNCWAEVSLIAIAIGFPINRGSGVRSHEIGHSLGMKLISNLKNGEFPQ